MHAGGPLLVVAGAGSGKTRVLTRRVAHLVEERHVSPREVLAITFTNKAAGEMKERVAALVGPRSRVMWVSTFHSACVRILRAEAGRLGFSSSFSIYDSADSQRLFTLVGRELDLDPKRSPARSLAARVSALKNELVDAEDFARRAETPEERELSGVYTSYTARLREANALDFDDLIGHAVALLQAFPEAAQTWRERFRHVLVDEYQDTNHAQYALVRELVGGPAAAVPTPEPTAELCVVGDADQSIYAFRGADIRNISEFEADFPDATTVLLEQNYRSTQTVLSAANAVIAQNPHRRPKRLWSAAGDGEKVVAYVADDEHDEAAFVAREVERLGAQHGVRPGDVAVFYRTNAQSRVLEEVFVRVGLPYRVVGGVRFYERREVRDLLAYLRALVNPDDTVSVRRVLNTPRRGVGDRAEAALEAMAARERVSFGRVLGRAADAPGISSRAAKGVAGFHQLMEDLRADVAAGAGPADVLEAVLDRTGYLQELQLADAGAGGGPGAENCAELVGVAREFEERSGGAGVAAFLEQASLVADTDDLPEQDGSAGVVTLMTLHAAKGLEFPVVFLTGLEEGVFPHVRALSDTAELAEERRLAYVGITRARERLHVSRAVSRTAWGQMQWNPASRFLAEVPAELLRWERGGPEPAGGRGRGGLAVGRGLGRRLRVRGDDGARTLGRQPPRGGEAGRRRPARGPRQPRGPRARGRRPRHPRRLRARDGRRGARHGRARAGRRRLRRRGPGEAAAAALRAPGEDLGLTLGPALEAGSAVASVCGGGTVTVRTTHAYRDGVAPYSTVLAHRPARVGAGSVGGGQGRRLRGPDCRGRDDDHHHAVGRDHRPWYDRQRPDVFAAALRGAKDAVDPAGVMDPGVLL